jgi:hypothetical protein
MRLARKRESILESGFAGVLGRFGSLWGTRGVVCVGAWFFWCVDLVVPFFRSFIFDRVSGLVCSISSF